jgi:hypothetical protein
VLLHRAADEALAGLPNTSAVPTSVVHEVAGYVEAARGFEPPDARYLINHRGHLVFVKLEKRRFVTATLLRETTFTATAAVLALAASYRVHHHGLPLGLGVLAGGIAYLHVFGGTPEWTMSLVLGLSLVTAVVDWRAAGSKPSRLFSHREGSTSRFAMVSFRESG